MKTNHYVWQRGAYEPANRIIVWSGYRTTGVPFEKHIDRFSCDAYCLDVYEGDRIYQLQILNTVLDRRYVTWYGELWSFLMELYELDVLEKMEAFYPGRHMLIERIRDTPELPPVRKELEVMEADQLSTMIFKGVSND